MLARALRHLALSRFCRAFYMLCKAGISLDQCAEKAALVAGNAVFYRRLRSAADSARAGNPMSDGFSRLLPVEFLESFHVAEETGTLDTVARRLADKYGESAEFFFEQFCIWLPRVIYLVIMIFTALMVIRLASSLYGSLFTL